MVIVICATFSHIQQLLMVLLEQLREELLTHIIPQLWHSWKHPCTSSVCSMAFPGKHHCIIPWIFNSSCFNRLQMQGHGIAKVSVCHCSQQHLWDTAPCLYFIALLFNTTQTLGIPQPNNPILNAKYRDAGEEKPPSSQQGPSAFPGWVRHGLFQGIQQWLWGQLTLRAATGKQQLQLTGRFGSESLAKCLLQQPKAAVLQ